MKTTHEIAQGLSVEIVERFGIETTVAGGMYYSLNEKEEPRTLGQVTSDFLNSYSVRHEKFSITVKEDKFHLSIASDDAKNWAGPIDGLPGVIVGTMFDNQSSSHTYHLADPDAIDSMLEKISELFKDDPVAER